MDEEGGNDDVEDTNDEHDGHGDVYGNANSFWVNLAKGMISLSDTFIYLIRKYSVANEGSNGDDCSDNTTNQVDDPEYDGASLQIQAETGLLYSRDCQTHC